MPTTVLTPVLHIPLVQERPLTPKGVGIVGTGPWGQALRKTAESLGCMVLWQVSPRNEVDLRFLPDYMQEVDAVLCAVPPNFQVEVAAICAAKNVPCRLEKPLAYNSRHAGELVTLTERGAPLYAGHLHVTSQAFQTLLQGAATRIHRDIPGVHISSRAGGPVIHGYMHAAWDWLPHDISTVLAFLGALPTEKLSASWYLEHADTGEWISFDVTGLGDSYGDCRTSRGMTKHRRFRAAVRDTLEHFVYGDYPQQFYKDNGENPTLFDEPQLTTSLKHFFTATQEERVYSMKLAAQCVDVLEGLFPEGRK